MSLPGAVVYRAHNPHWSFAPDSGAGAAKHGGRFNCPGVPALYTSSSYELAITEAHQGLHSLKGKDRPEPVFRYNNSGRQSRGVAQPETILCTATRGTAKPGPRFLRAHIELSAAYHEFVGLKAEKS